MWAGTPIWWIISVMTTSRFVLPLFLEAVVFKEFIQKLLMRSASAAQSTGFIKQYAAPPERSSRSTIELSAGIMAIKRGEFSPIASRHCFITQSISEFCINASQITISGFPLKIAEASLFPSRSINSAKNPAPSASEQERQSSPGDPVPLYPEKHRKCSKKQGKGTACQF